MDTRVFLLAFTKWKNHVQALMGSRFPRLNTAREAAINDLPGLRIGTIRSAFANVIW